MGEQRFKNNVEPLTLEEKQVIGQVLDSVFKRVGKRFALEVYLIILESGQAVTERAIARAIAGRLKAEAVIEKLKAKTTTETEPTKTEIEMQLGTVSETITELRRKGIILDRPRVKGKKLSLFLINPEMLFHIAYIDLMEEFPAIQKKMRRMGTEVPSPSREKFLQENKGVIDKLKDMWVRSGVGLGAEKETFQVQGWDGFAALANVCGWVSAFGKELSGKKIFMLTPHLRILEDRMFRELLSVALNGLKCTCVFFVYPEKKKFFEKLENNLPGPPTTYEMYNVGRFIFPKHLRVIVLGDLLGGIFLKRGDHYVGEIYHKSPEDIKDLIDCISEVKEKCRKENNQIG